jgi:hypothetical protein
MPSNELVLLDQIIERRQSEREVRLAEESAFELFACEQALRDYDVSPDEIETGIVGGGNDGAIDGVYTFLDGNLLAADSEIFDEDFTPSRMSAGIPLLLFLVQAKRSESFTETALDLVSSSTRRLLDLSESEDDLRTLYSDLLVERFGLFRTALQLLATRHPRVQVRFSYVTRGITNAINAKVQAKASDLERQFQGLLPDARGAVEFLGAAELWRRASMLPSYTLQLTYQENATSGTSHVALISLRDYLDFLTDDDGALRRHIFDWNVRDYQGDVEVNREIRASLLTEETPEFWWLNNGITIVCSKTSITGKTYSLDDVQVVNGLQTSYAIYSALHGTDGNPALDRSVLVRILVTEDSKTRDRVIRATNHQTSVPAASLRATDEIQRTIEAFFFDKGWYYDRRKNYYRNIGKSPERIVGISLLAQSVMAMGLCRPDNSRARPSSLLKRDEDYSTIFSSTIPLWVYFWIAKAQRETDSFLASEEASTTPPERTNLRFYLSMLATCRLLGVRVRTPAQLSETAETDRSIKDADLPACLAELRSHFNKYEKLTGNSQDKIAKGSDFVEYILNRAFPQKAKARSRSA